jgi:putative MATE family efflux protein
MTSFALHALVGVVDLLFVSSLGTEAVASVAAAAQIHFIVLSLLSAVTTGTVALVAREIGAGRRDEAVRATRTSVVLAVVVGGVTMLGMPFTRNLLSFMDLAPAVSDLGGTCLSTLLGFNIPLAVVVTLSMAVRGAGDMRTPLVLGVIENVVNVVADYALIFGNLGAPELGAVGSAWASGLSFTVGAGLIVALWLRGTLVIPRGAREHAATRNMSRRLLRIGTPTAIQDVTFNLGMIVYISIVASFGTESVSAYLIGVRILSFCFVPGFGFAQAASTLVGQDLGANRPQRASRSGWRAAGGATLVMGSVGLVIVLLAAELAAWFGAVGDETIRLTIIMIYILGAAQPLMAVEFSLGGALRGAGDTRFPLLAILVGLIVFRLGGALLVALPFFGTITAVWCCLLADWIVKASMLSLRFASDRWKHVKV